MMNHNETRIAPKKSAEEEEGEEKGEDIRKKS